MESLINTAKRKKRKTRKCLDNIRKRSRKSGQIVFDKDNGKVCDLSNNKIKKCLITSNRLTLRMFPKTVRSETITRPVLTDLKQKQYLNLDELIKGSNVLGTIHSSNVRMPELMDTFDKNIENLNKENFELISTKCALNYSSICEVPVSKTINNKEDELSKNMNQFSSLYSNEINDKSPNSLGGQSVSTVTTPSSIHDEYGYKLYEEFMSEIPIYLQHNATFIKEDVMQKTKVYLQHLFIESCYQECEDNVWKCIKSNNATKMFYAPTEIIVHNPIDYIRLGNVQQQNPFHQSTKLRGTVVASLGTPHSPIAPPSPPASPETSSNVNMHDTPDYLYYPHRLN